MGKALVLAVCITAITVSASFVSAQGLPGVTGTPNLGFSNLFPGQNMRFVPTFAVGFQTMGTAFNLPGVSSALSVPGLDLSIQDANVWIGSAGVEIIVSPLLSVFMRVDGNLQRTVNVRTSEFPSPPSGPIPYNWDGTRLEWWDIEGSAAYRIAGNLRVVGGFRLDHLSLALGDPRDINGNPVDFSGIIPPLTVVDRTANGDIQTKLWIPFLGLQFRGPNYNASVIWSPFASGKVSIPTRWLAYTADFLIGGSETYENVQWKFTSFNPGAFLEGSLEYDVNVDSTYMFRLWCKGSWSKIRGAGNLDSVNNSQSFFPFPPFTSSSHQSSSERNTSTLTRYFISGGIALNVLFR